MSKAIDNLMAAQKRAMAGRPKVGGFPYLAETLRRAGVTRNLWFLPACESLYLIDFITRKVAYYGCNGEEYVEAYPAVEVD